MGADGGITWVRVRDREGFLSLMRPFWRVTRFDDYHGSEHDAYLAKYPLPKDALIATYGTDHEVQGYDELKRMLEEAEYLDEVYDAPKDATFVNIIEAEYTRPWWREVSGGVIMRALIGRDYGTYSWLGTDEAARERCRVRIAERRTQDLLKLLEHSKSEPVLVMRVSSWAKKINEYIYPNSFGSAETWT